MAVDKGTLLTLTGGVRLKQRVQHPKVHERKDRDSHYWFFRYRHDELRPDGSIKTARKFHTIGPCKGDNAITKKQAEAKRDVFLAELNAAPTRCEAAVIASQPVEVTAILFGKLAELWRKDYVDNPKVKLAMPTREKYRTRLDNHILPRWKDTRLGEFRTKEILDWLQAKCSSWHMMTDLRNIMSGIFTRAQEWEIVPESFANPMSRVKVGRKWTVRPERILDDDETAAVFTRLEDPHLLICETCLDTGTRISEAVGLQLKHSIRRKVPSESSNDIAAATWTNPRRRIASERWRWAPWWIGSNCGSRKTRSPAPAIGFSFRRKTGASPCGTRG